MPFIPHTEDEIKKMLATIGVDSIDDLFSEIPAQLQTRLSDKVPTGLSEMEALRLFSQRAAQDKRDLCFIGAGAYEHHIPSAVWQLAARGELMTAYTPYQAEASQGGLQLLYEYQTMIASLTGMDVSNASLYDGASALAEAVLMAVRSNRKSKSKRILMPTNCHPNYRQTVRTIVAQQQIELVEIPFNETGIVDVKQLQHYNGEDFAAVIIAQPNFFGRLEDVDEITDWAHQQNALVIACVNPTAIALLKEPGRWGQQGADICCGEGQPLGIPLASGGPYFGFMACKEALIRQLPGRVVGRTTDMAGNSGFTLTLQAREQHIRRSKATSNICTNQGLAVTAATIYMSLLGPIGLKKVAQTCHSQNVTLQKMMAKVAGVEQVFTAPSFHETLYRFKKPVHDIIQSLAEQGIQIGYPLTDHYPQFENCILVCTTETKTTADLQHLVTQLENVLK